jgi:hypothetical protein
MTKGEPMRRSRRGPRTAAIRELALLLGMLWIGAAAARSADPEIRIVSESDRQVIFEVTAPPPALRPIAVDGRRYVEIAGDGLERAFEPGQPDLPAVEVRLALPPGAEGAAELLESDALPLGAARPLPVPREDIRLAPGSEGDPSEAVPDVTLDYAEDPVAYGGIESFPGRPVEPDRVRPWRHFRLLPVRVALARYDPAAGELTWFTRIRVRVVFVTARPSGAGAGGGIPYTAPETRWEPLFEATILNYASARGFRRWQPLSGALPRGAMTEGAQEWRVAVDTTGVYRLEFGDLAAAGIDTPDLAWSDVRLLVRGYDDADDADPFREYEIAFDPDDADGDGTFESGESLVFYGQDAWDFFDLSAGDRRYGRRNVYWMIAGAGAGTAIAARAAWFDWTGLTPRTSYVRTDHFEQNLYYTETCAAGDTRTPDEGPYGIHSDHYNWTFPRVGEPTASHRIKVVRFDLPTVLSLSQVCVRVQGQHLLSGTALNHQPRLWLSRSAAEYDTTWAFPGNPLDVPALSALTVCADGAGIPGAVTGTGKNYLKIYIPEANDGIDNRNAGQVGIDWAEVTFRGSSDVRNHRLEMPLDGITGHQQLLVRRLPSRDVRVYDIADRRAPVRLALADSLFAASGNFSDLRLQVDCGDGARPPRIVVIEARTYDPLPADAVTRRVGSPLTQFEGEDLVAIYPPRFGSQVEPLLSHREGQGHQVLRAPTDAVYDTYSGGRAHPFAVKRLLRRMWRASAPAPDDLLLLGDASNDLAGYALGLNGLQSDTSYVPTITVSGHSFSSTGTEIVSADPWLVDNLSGDWGENTSYYPDLNVGRVSCGTEAEAQRYVEKVLAYEASDPTASWRTRLVYCSDDDFSSTIGGLGGGDNYQRQPGESAFLSITRRAMALTMDDSLFLQFAVDSVFLNDYMDSVVALGRCVPDTNDPTRCLRDTNGNIVRIGSSVSINFAANRVYCVDHVKPALLGFLSRGALYWAYQGHSNRSQMTHEEVFRHSRLAGVLDVFDLQNLGRPFIYGGYGCHLNDFASHYEAHHTRGDAMTETMLFCCEGDPPNLKRGAIAAIASSDYESIGHDYEVDFSEAAFPDPPRDDSGQPRWRLGEVYTLSKLKLPSVGSRRYERLTYNLLGDPGLRIGLAPPWVRLQLNGTAWASETSEYASDRPDDSLSVLIQLNDESHVSAPAVTDYFGAVPGTALEVREEAREGRYLALRYRTQVQRLDYGLQIRAIDYEGTTRAVEVHVPFTIQFFEQVGSELEPLAPGATLDAAARLALAVRCGAHLEADDLKLFLGASEVPRESATQSAASGPFVWDFRYGDLPAGFEPDTLAVQVHQRDGSWRVLARLPVTLGALSLSLDGAQWVPSPFAEETNLVYRLTDTAANVRLRLFTASGRRILEETTLATEKGTRHFLWDGRDADGDAVANGLYFYELSVYDAEGRRADRVVDKLVRAR